MQDRRDAGLQGCKIGGMQDRRDAEQKGFRTGGMRTGGTFMLYHIILLQCFLILSASQHADFVFLPKSYLSILGQLVCFLSVYT